MNNFVRFIKKIFGILDREAHPALVSETGSGELVMQQFNESFNRDMRAAILRESQEAANHVAMGPTARVTRNEEDNVAFTWSEPRQNMATVVYTHWGRNAPQQYTPQRFVPMPAPVRTDEPERIPEERKIDLS